VRPGYVSMDSAEVVHSSPTRYDWNTLLVCWIGAADGTRRLVHLRQQVRTRLAHALVTARHDDVVLGRVEAHHAHRLLSSRCGVPAPTPELRLQLLHLHRQSLSSSRRRSAASAAASTAAASAASSAAALARSACSAQACSIISLASATSAASGSLRSPCFSASAVASSTAPSTR
jgi:hypothetical protein